MTKNLSTRENVTKTAKTAKTATFYRYIPIHTEFNYFYSDPYSDSHSDRNYGKDIVKYKYIIYNIYINLIFYTNYII